MTKKLLTSGLAFTLATTLNATSFFTTELDNHVKSFNDEIAMFFNNDAIFKSYPKMNVFENEKQYIFKFELAGIEKKDIKVSISNQNILSISGEKKSLTKEEQKDMIRQEHFYGSFNRSISLPDNIDRDNIKVTYKNGVVSVTVDKDLKKTKTKILNIE
jgi:HSP20 family protein